MLVVMLVSACTDEPADASMLVMEAWIDNDGYPVVLLSKSLSPSVTETDVADLMVRWGRVTISDGQDTVIMTGGVDHAVFPPFSYRTYQMKGQVGRKYTITADYAGREIKAVSTILPPAEIVSVSFSKVEGAHYSGKLTFKAPDTSDTCRYIVYTRVYGEELIHYPSFLGNVTSSYPCQEYEVPLYRGKHIGLPGTFQPEFMLGDTVDVILARVEPEVYRFWDAYQNEVYFGNNIFLSTSATLHGNVTGGLGVFSARGISRRTAIVK